MDKTSSIKSKVADGTSAPDDALCREFADNIPTLAWIANPDGYITWYNRRWHDYCGTTPEEMEGWGWQSVHDPDTLPKVMERWQGCITAGADFEMTFPLRGKDGVFRPFLTRASCIKDSHENVVRWFGNNTDVTAQRHAEQALASADIQLRRAIVAGNGVGAWDLDLSTGLVTADGRFAALYGVTTDKAARGAPMSDFFAAIHPADRPRVEEAAKRTLETGADLSEEYRLQRDNGETLWVAATGGLVRDQDGNPAHFPGITFDISGRKRAEIRQTALLHLSDCLRELDDEDEISFVACRILAEALDVTRVGYGVVDMAAETISIARDWHAPGIASLAGTLTFRDYGSYIADLKIGRILTVGDVRLDHRTSEGGAALEAIGARSFVNMPLVEQGDLVALLYAAHDQPRMWHHDDMLLMREIAERVRAATERLLAVQARQASEEQFRVFAQTIPNQLWAARPDGKLYWFNRQVFSYSGRTEAVLDGDGWGAIVHPDDLPAAGAAWAQSLTSGDVYEVEFRIRRHDGEYRWFLVRAEPTRDEDDTINGWVGTNTEIEEQRRQASDLEALAQSLESQVAARTAELMSAEEELRQSQKMEAVGQLTGGLAHDFNNLLTAISGGLEMIALRISQGRHEDVERYSLAAQSAAKRAAALTHRLLAFSRRQTLDPKPTDVNRLVAEMQELVGRTVGPAIELKVEPAEQLWPTKVDQNQLENALLNLVINARDAMPEGGCLTIATTNKTFDLDDAREHELEPGDYLFLCVSDTGSGMSAAVIAKAFDPFFTTKPLGVGTGLGLSMVYGFVRQSGGQVRIHSEPGGGTRVCLYLPRIEGELPSAAGDADAVALPRVSDGDTVLVVDDEAGIRMLVTDILGELGYESLEAEDGKEGLAILQSEARIDLLITDVGLPGGMNGRQMADEARRSRPDLKILFITGYAENAVLGEGNLDLGMHVMTKPFELEALGRRIRELIEG